MGEFNIENTNFQYYSLESKKNSFSHFYSTKRNKRKELELDDDRYLKINNIINQLINSIPNLKDVDFELNRKGVKIHDLFIPRKKLLKENRKRLDEIHNLYDEFNNENNNKKTFSKLIKSIKEFVLNFFKKNQNLTDLPEKFKVSEEEWSEVEWPDILRSQAEELIGKSIKTAEYSKINKKEIKEGKKLLMSLNMDRLNGDIYLTENTNIRKIYQYISSLQRESSEYQKAKNKFIELLDKSNFYLKKDLINFAFENDADGSIKIFIDGISNSVGDLDKYLILMICYDWFKTKIFKSEHANPVLDLYMNNLAKYPDLFKELNEVVPEEKFNEIIFG